jgi:pyruvate dehydrogenase (quinone)/pyruvate oxidase
VQGLVNWGVSVVFGLPGDAINVVVEALRKRSDEIRFVQTRSPGAAALAACGYAKFGDRLGVCLATAGPGGIQLLPGLYDAKLDGQPLLAITGMPYHDLLGTRSQQDVPLDRLCADAAAYSACVMGPTHAETATDIACRTAVTGGTAAHLTIPVDIQAAPLGRSMRGWRSAPRQTAAAAAAGAGLPAEAELDRAAAWLNQSRRVCLLVGRGALGARAEVAELAERLAAPVAAALLGKSVMADDNPHFVGIPGLLGSRPAQDTMEGCETLVLIGTSFPYLEYYPRAGQARIVQIERDPGRIGLRVPADAALVGDAATVLRALLPRLERHEDRGFLEQAQAGMLEWREELDKHATRGDTPMKPQLVLSELDRALPGTALIAVDNGATTTWAARYLRMRDQRRFAWPGLLGVMGCALPYGIGGAIAYPDRMVACVVGDGALATQLGELATVARHGLDLKILVLKNNILAQVKWEQMVLLGNPEYASDLHPIDFAAVARGFGLTAYTIERPEECGEALARAVATPGPVLVEAVVDPHEPPLPPKATLTQAAQMAEAMVRGVPSRRRMALTLASDTVRQTV